jgi:hypothetical protein
MPVTRKLVGVVGGVLSRPAWTGVTTSTNANMSTNETVVDSLARVGFIISFFLSKTEQPLITGLTAVKER